MNQLTQTRTGTLARRQQRRRLVPLTCLLICISSATKLLAFQEAPPAKPEQPKAARKDSVDDELLKKLVPDLALEKPAAAETPQTSAEKTQDELDRTVQSMRSVSKRLSQKDVSDETRRQQKSILDDIDALIKKLQQPPQDSSQNQSSSNSDSQQNQSKSQDRQSAQRKEQQQREQQEAQQKQKQQTGTGEGSSQQSANKSAESTENEQQRKAATRAAELAKRRALIDEVWGHLPPALREKMLNVGNENLLPQYEDVIRRYYEAIALPPENDKRPGVRKPSDKSGQ